MSPVKSSSYVAGIIKPDVLDVECNCDGFEKFGIAGVGSDSVAAVSLSGRDPASPDEAMDWAVCAIAGQELTTADDLKIQVTRPVSLIVLTSLTLLY